MSDFKNFLPDIDPRKSLVKWFNEAKTAEENPYYFTLSTIGLDGSPNSRTLLIKEITEDSIIFFSNYTSTKAREIEKNPNVSLTFYWHNLGRQVRLKGRASKVSKVKSQEYFFSRPYESQVASFISKQSGPVESREILEAEFSKAFEKYKDTGVPFPEHWGGYSVELSEIIFFIYGAHRLNDRFKFLKDGTLWRDERLYP